jgi:transglutaminase-like putative cysteine protease
MKGGWRLDSIDINHRTRYAYRQPVQFTSHRLLLRPRESRDVRVLAYDLDVTAGAALRWSQDVSGNAVAVATFAGLAQELLVESRARVELGARPYPVFDIAASAIQFPFRYSDDEWVDLGALSALPEDGGGRLRAWAQGFVAATPTDTLSLLKDLNTGTGHAVAYEAREDQGTQSPAETLSRARGSCRDIATLFIEAVRSLGFGARAASGYLHDPMRKLTGSADAGSTHAWAEVYVPGAGWITFDPTNNSVGAANLIPVAVARDIRLALPVTGSFAGAADAFADMSVEVSVRAA